MSLAALGAQIRAARPIVGTASWGLDGFTTSTHAFEFRPGGIWDFTMHGPDGADYPNWIEWLEISPPHRIVYRHGASADDPHSFVATVTLVEHGAETEVILRSEFNSKAQRDDVIERFRAIEGGRQTLARLATYDSATTRTVPR